MFSEIMLKIRSAILVVMNLKLINDFNDNLMENIN